MHGKVIVLMGGESSEREISLNTGNAVISALRRKGIQAESLDAIGDYVKQLLILSPDIVFIALHGHGGEDGCVQGLLESLGIPYTGSSILGSAISMDKVNSKRIWQAIGISTPPFTLCYSAEEAHKLIKTFDFPFAIKPVFGGSSIGVTMVRKAKEIEDAYYLAAKYGPVMLESWIVGDEYTVGILKNKTLPSIHVMYCEKFYDYQAKYCTDNTHYICPSKLSPNEEQQLQSIALRAFLAINARYWGRVDFMRDLNGKFWLLEVNTIPGLTEHSLVPKAAKVAGMAFDELILEILNKTVN